ncbi:5366_t:CDS:2 [Paraglomus brasilianum]|uniref:peptidyl-tRNA hydrolase n=1 Tax=Paraglomus brasilianum TaxID=144538 RepID=A0A9N8VW88_9GLOM|nr:5366_t:CDS:2 [Paraglomus brasilianum]
MIPITTLLIVTTCALYVGYKLGRYIESSKSGRVSKNDVSDASKKAFEDTPVSNSRGVLDAEKYDDFKLVLVVRNDLGMTKGKAAAQCSHATLACYKRLSATNPKLLRAWEYSGQPKITLRANGRDELLELEKTACRLNLCAEIIQDAGRTQISSGSMTVLGIGPGEAKCSDRSSNGALEAVLNLLYIIFDI